MVCIAAWCLVALLGYPDADYWRSNWLFSLVRHVFIFYQEKEDVTRCDIVNPYDTYYLL